MPSLHNCCIYFSNICCLCSYYYNWLTEPSASKKYELYEKSETVLFIVFLPQWPRFHVVRSSCFVHNRDRFVIGIRIKEKHIRARHTGI
jgi:hypothetical protein